jgi:hypothetical protein
MGKPGASKISVANLFVGFRTKLAPNWLKALKFGHCVLFC